MTFCPFTRAPFGDGVLVLTIGMAVPKVPELSAFMLNSQTLRHAARPKTVCRTDGDYGKRKRLSQE